MTGRLVLGSIRSLRGGVTMPMASRWLARTTSVTPVTTTRRFFTPSAVRLQGADGGRDGGSPVSFIEKASLAGLNALLGQFIHKPGKFDSALSGMKIESFGKGTVTCSLKVEPKVQNAYNTLHGGATATIVDIVGTLALLTKDPTKAGVSVDMNITYIRAAKEGTDLIIEGSVLKSGKKLGFTEVRIMDKDRNLIATGRHTKAL